ncbi:MAG: hypothetical protein WA919_15020 [Coleofasciculaceae cyanobacterium]
MTSLGLAQRERALGASSQALWRHITPESCLHRNPTNRLFPTCQFYGVSGASALRIDSPALRYLGILHDQLCYGILEILKYIDIAKERNKILPGSGKKALA